MERKLHEDGTRIVYICHHAFPGGGGSAILNYLKAANTFSFEPIVIFLEAGPLVEEVEQESIEVHVIEAKRLSNPLGFMAVIRTLIKFVRKCQPDIVCTNSPVSHIYGGPAAKILGIPCIYWVHGVELRRASRSGIAQSISVRVPYCCIIANSTYTKRKLLELYGIAEPIRVVYYGIDTDRFAPNHAEGLKLRSELGIDKYSIVITLIGRLQRLKGQHIFLEAAALLARDLPSLTFLLVGGNVPRIEPDFPDILRNMMIDLGLQDRVIMVGHRDDVERFYFASDIIVHATTFPLEAFGMVIVEAMLCGKPVIASKAGGPLEIVEDGKTGLLATPSEPVQLAEKMRILAEDETLRKEMGAAGRRTANRLFSNVRMARELESVYRQACDR